MEGCHAVKGSAGSAKTEFSHHKCTFALCSHQRNEVIPTEEKAAVGERYGYSA